MMARYSARLTGYSPVANENVSYDPPMGFWSFTVRHFRNEGLRGHALKRQVYG